MIVLGLIVLVVAAVFGADLAYRNNTPSKDPTVFSQSIGIHHTRGLFVLGVIVGAALLFGLSLIRAGIRHHGKKRAAGKTRNKRTEDESAQLRAERDALQTHNDTLQDRLATGPVPGATPAPDSPIR